MFSSRSQDTAQSNPPTTSSNAPTSSGNAPTTRGSAPQPTSSKSDQTTRVFVTLYFFRGDPDEYKNRHVLFYLTSPNEPDFHKTVHIRRQGISHAWRLVNEDGRKNWDASFKFAGRLDAGEVLVPRGEEEKVVDALASVPLTGRPSDWHCHHYVYEALEALAEAGLQTFDWADDVFLLLFHAMRKDFAPRK